MKNLTQLVFIFYLTIGSVSAQQEKGIVGANNWLCNWSEFKPHQKDYGEPTQILTGNITQDISLNKRDVYLLLGNVIVADSVTLTIEPGTIILGDYESKASLTIAKGALLIADGLETDPIVFTSNRSVKRAGDWGGIIILGDAPTNKFGKGSVASYYSKLSASNYKYTNYGGENPNSNSGTMRYVRIEYAGKRIKTGGHYSGLLLAGVGSETTLENVMVSYSAGNAIEVMGGNLALHKFVSYRSNSNDYKFNYGTDCKLNNSLAIRYPYVSGSSRSRSLYVSSYNKKEDIDFTKKGTLVTAKNLTLINISKDLNTDIEKGLVKEAIYVAHNASLDMNKSVISGFNPAVILDEKIVINQENLEKIKFTDMYFNNCNGNIFTEHHFNNEDLENWYGNITFFNVYSKADNSEIFIDINNDKKPDFRLGINSIIATSDIKKD